jgi:hypothetical protein
MKEFLMRHAPVVTGILSGFDHLIFRGTLRVMSAVEVMNSYLYANHVLFKDFGRHVESVSKRIKDSVKAAAHKLKRPVEYLSSPGIAKEDHARAIMQRDKIERGLIAVLTCVRFCFRFLSTRRRRKSGNRLL